jgi:ABC-type antimicrobial peptide transport system, ATPase component
MITLSNIVKVYQNEQTTYKALQGVSLTIAQGDFISIMGRSGCGKTTLLNIIGCIDSISEGTYYFEDINIPQQSKDELAHLRRERIGYVFQAFNLIDELTCEENVALTLGYSGVRQRERKKSAQELLDTVGLADRAKHYPAQLSGGQKQRVAIARAISNAPTLILADEPTGNLDYSNGTDIMNLLKELNQRGTTVVMVTHDEEFSAYANHVYYMRDGKIL